MAIRPTDMWREDIAQEAREVAAGQLAPDRAVMAKLFPESLLAQTDEVLSAFEFEVRGFSTVSDEQVLAAVERMVLKLNAVNARHGDAAYETNERELLCDYIDQTLTEAGIDVGALTTRHGLSRYALTDRWRQW